MHHTNDKVGQYGKTRPIEKNSANVEKFNQLDNSYLPSFSVVVEFKFFFCKLINKIVNNQVISYWRSSAVLVLGRNQQTFDVQLGQYEIT